MLQIISSVLCQLNLDVGSDICSKILKLKLLTISSEFHTFRLPHTPYRDYLTSCQQQNTNYKSLHFLIFWNTSAKEEVSLVSTRADHLIPGLIFFPGIYNT